MTDGLKRRERALAALIQRFEQSRTWMNFVVVVKRKALLCTFCVLAIVGSAFQYQTNALSRITACHQRADRVEGRADLRAVLLRVVDLEDVFPGDPRAILYTSDRSMFINQEYPALPPVEC